MGLMSVHEWSGSVSEIAIQRLFDLHEELRVVQRAILVR